MSTYDGVFEGSRRIGVVALLVAVIFTGLGTPRLAYAHNALVSTSPENGSTVATPPDLVVLTFNEPALATGTKVLVTGPDGAAVAKGEPSLVDNTVRQNLQPALPAGQYTVDWRVTSADGHPVNGTLTFRARAGAKTQATAPPNASGTLSVPPSPGVGSTAGDPTSGATSTPGADSSSATPVEGSDGSSGSAPWLWLLAIIPVALAALLGWRFSRRRG